MGQGMNRGDVLGIETPVAPFLAETGHNATIPFLTHSELPTTMANDDTFCICAVTLASTLAGIVPCVIGCVCGKGIN